MEGAVPKTVQARVHLLPYVRKCPKYFEVQIRHSKHQKQHKVQKVPADFEIRLVAMPMPYYLAKMCDTQED